MPVLEPRTSSASFHRAAAVVGIKFRFHDLRHVWASVVLQLGGDSALNFVSNNLGHTMSSFTLDTYAHFLPNRAAAFLAPIDTIFHGGESHKPSHTTDAGADILRAEKPVCRPESIPSTLACRSRLLQPLRGRDRLEPAQE
jgi:hypothetical protein